MINYKETEYVVKYIKKRFINDTLKLAVTKKNRLDKAYAKLCNEQSIGSAESYLEVVENVLSKFELQQLKNAIRANNYRKNHKYDHVYKYTISDHAQIKLIEMKRMLDDEYSSQEILELAIGYVYDAMENERSVSKDGDFSFFIDELEKYKEK